MKKTILYAVIAGVLLLAFPLLALLQSTGATAEAVGQANLRAGAGVETLMVGEIRAGTRYPVIGRSEFYPWLLLGDPTSSQPIGWVFAELVMFSGDINTVPVSQLVIDETMQFQQPVVNQGAPTATATLDMQLNGVAIVMATATPTFPSTGVTGTVSGEINIRFGPGIEYPRIGVGRTGDSYEILARHSQLPWLQIRYTSAPNGFGWVANDLLEIQGNVLALPTISQLVFNLPTLTPTLPAVRPSSLLVETPIPISPQFQALGDQLWAMMLAGGFEPETSRLGALFLMDLQTGEALTFGNDIAFSGMSLTKIPIMTELYGQIIDPLRNAEAVTLASMMICSENTSSNDVLRLIGGGDPFKGAKSVTDFMQQLGLSNTYVVAPFVIDPNNLLQPTEPIIVPTTTADRSITKPDIWNQMTVDDMGWLLGSLYQCAYHGRGALMETLAGVYSSRECQQMLHVMSSNIIGELIESGVPKGTRVAHKHGWIPDTHGDAGVVFTPGGDYVLVVVLHNPVWLDFSESFPLIAEISRTIYNHYNPNAPLQAIHRDPIPEECNLLGNPLIDDLMSPNFSRQR